MVVLQPTAFCNINCSYCYLPDRSNKHVMAQSTVTRLFSEVFASGWCCVRDHRAVARRRADGRTHLLLPRGLRHHRAAAPLVGERKALLPDQRHAGERRLVPAVPGMERRHRRQHRRPARDCTTATARRAAARAPSTRRWRASAACRRTACRSTSCRCCRTTAWPTPTGCSTSISARTSTRSASTSRNRKAPTSPSCSTRRVPSCARASPPSCAASGTRRGRAAR